jgi:hypothetical protein
MLAGARYVPGGYKPGVTVVVVGYQCSVRGGRPRLPRNVTPTAGARGRIPTT